MVILEKKAAWKFSSFHRESSFYASHWDDDDDDDNNTSVTFNMHEHESDCEDSYYNNGDDNTSVSSGITISSIDTDASISLDHTGMPSLTCLSEESFSIITEVSNDSQVTGNSSIMSWAGGSLAQMTNFVFDTIYADLSEHAVEFDKIDKDRDGKASQHEISQWVRINPCMWSMLSVNLNLSESECIDVATRVTMEISADARNKKQQRQQVTKKQFKTFKKLYVDDPRGSQEFFHRSVFAAFDEDFDNHLNAKEFNKFIDVFYESGSIFKGDCRLPQKEELVDLLYKKYDINDDGLFSFKEIQPIISGLAFHSIFDDCYILSSKTSIADTDRTTNTFLFRQLTKH